ncbi:MAG: hypothetical protein KGZ61_06145 [Sandarakinorhabdus sp.]|nr:hypothetical protein [Sandarakinorhabdus sp.]
MTTEQISLFIAIGLLLLGFLAALHVLRRMRAGPADRTDGADGADGADQTGPPVPAPAAAAASGADMPSPFLPAPDGEPDDLTRIKGIGPRLSALLAELGVFHFAQIASWTPEQLALVDSRLGTFRGRPERDQWQSQAALLAAGDIKAYERAHGKLGPAA